MTDERRDRYAAAMASYAYGHIHEVDGPTPHCYFPLADGAIEVADKEQTALQARVADLEEQVIAMGGHQAAAEEHAATIGRVRAALDYCDRGSAIAIRAALDGEEA